MTTESPKKKVLIVITKSNFGGAQRYVFDIAKNLKNRFDVTVACGGSGLLVEKLKSENIQTMVIPFLARDVNIFKDIFAFFHLFRLFRSQKPDIIHLNSSKIGGLGALAGTLARVPRIVFTAHGWAWNEDRGILSKTIIRFAYFIVCAFSDRIIAVSKAIYEQGLSLPYAKDKMTIIHNGVENIEILDKSLTKNMLPEKSLSAGFIVGTVAELHPIKGLTYAIQAFAELKELDIAYVIWAEGDERKKLEVLIEKLNLKDRVYMPGNIPDAALFMKAFDCFLLPSLSEALGYVVLEAGRAEIPVIATSVGGVPEIIEDMQSGILVHPKNTKEIVRAITFMFENKEKRELMAKNLHASVIEKFSIESMIEKTRSVYEG